MLFSSTLFIFLFLPITLSAYLLLPWRLKNLWLLGTSLLFYFWGEAGYSLVMIASIGINFAFGKAVANSASKLRAKRWLTSAVAFNITLLAVFKYANFLTDNLNYLLVTLHFQTVSLNPVHLPLGISFFTFHALSYVIDVYRGDAPVQRKITNFGLYIALFPQLIAGPILRYHDVAWQITDRKHDSDLFLSGIGRFVVGFAKKMLLANGLGEIADTVFAIPSRELNSACAWIGIVCYTLQLYFDFSGYSDMAIGLGRMFGFRFLENFNYPYISHTVQEFWRRWHISLSNWFRDYLYIPLGGNKTNRARVYFNLIVVFVLCGFWHGASWTFIFWGLYHGLFLVLERLGLAALLAKLPRFFQHTYLLIVVTVGWVFFRSDTLPHALIFVKALFGAGPSETVYSAAALLNNWTLLLLGAGVIGATPIAGWLRSMVLRQLRGGMACGYTFVEYGTTCGLFVLSCAFLAAGTYNPFIYFRF
ncbi:MAG: MBOAT family protein [Betaproteobacteria bacterium]|nr:MBOAT family protein [Betaproteobacteria bacterium]